HTPASHVSLSTDRDAGGDFDVLRNDCLRGQRCSSCCKRDLLSCWDVNDSVEAVPVLDPTHRAERRASRVASELERVEICAPLEQHEALVNTRGNRWKTHTRGPREGDGPIGDVEQDAAGAWCGTTQSRTSLNRHAILEVIDAGIQRSIRRARE